MLTDKQRAQTAARQQRFRERQQALRRQDQAAKGLPKLPAISTIPGQARWRNALVAAQALVEQVADELTFRLMSSVAEPFAPLCRCPSGTVSLIKGETYLWIVTHLPTFGAHSTPVFRGQGIP